MADELADELYEKGIAIREEMLGPEHGRAKVESQPDFTGSSRNW